MLWQHVKWLVSELRVAAMLFAFGAFLVLPAAVLYDAARFHRVRAHVDKLLVQLSPSERAPNERVQHAFGRYSGRGRTVFGDVAWRACLDHVLCDGYLDLDQKMEAWLFWTPMLRVYYTDQQMFGVYLHKSGWLAGVRGAGAISQLAFGMDLNELSDRELLCLERVTRGRRRYPECPETARFISSQ